MSLNTSSNKPRERSFKVNGLTLTAKEWGTPGGIPAFGLHGWLDNANTFDRIAPELPELHLVALDLAGHGFSDHRQPGVHYEWVLDMQEMLAIARELQWDKFNLLGHSMGAAICSEFAGLFPEKVDRAVMIDGFIHERDNVSKRIKRLREAIEKMVDAHLKRPPVYDSVEAMIKRVQGATDQSYEAAAQLVARGYKQVDGGFTWRSDPRLRFPTPGRLMGDEIDELMRASTAPSLLIVAERGDKWYHHGIERRQKHHSHLRVENIDGPHHLHLEEQAGQVAALIRQHLIERR